MRPRTYRHTHTHTDARDHNTFLVVFDSREMYVTINTAAFSKCPTVQQFTRTARLTTGLYPVNGVSRLQFDTGRLTDLFTLIIHSVIPDVENAPPISISVEVK